MGEGRNRRAVERALKDAPPGTLSTGKLALRDADLAQLRITFAAAADKARDNKQQR